MAIREEIISIVVDPSLDDESIELSKAELIEGLIDKNSWSEICSILLQILQDDLYAAHWRTVAEVLWGAVLDQRDLPADRVIALLYNRLPASSSDDDDNLVWSITHRLKRVGYLSDYDPLQDPNIQKELSALRKP